MKERTIDQINKKIENNDDRNELNLDALFDKEFELYPGDSTQGLQTLKKWM